MRLRCVERRAPPRQDDAPRAAAAGPIHEYQ